MIPAPMPSSSVTTTVTTDAMVDVECGMTLDAHAQLLETIRSKENAPMMLGPIIADVAASNRLTTDQVIAVLKTLGYEPQREEAAVAFYPNICDPGNWYKVYNVVGPVTVDSIKERINNGGARKDPYDF